MTKIDNNIELDGFDYPKSRDESGEGTVMELPDEDNGFEKDNQFNDSNNESSFLEDEFFDGGFNSNSSSSSDESSGTPFSSMSDDKEFLQEQANENANAENKGQTENNLTENKPKKKGNGLMIGAAVGTGALLLAGAGVFAYSLMSEPAKPVKKKKAQTVQMASDVSANNENNENGLDVPVLGNDDETAETQIPSVAEASGVGLEVKTNGASDVSVNLGGLGVDVKDNQVEIKLDEPSENVGENVADTKETKTAEVKVESKPAENKQEVKQEVKVETKVEVKAENKPVDNKPVETKKAEVKVETKPVESKQEVKVVENKSVEDADALLLKQTVVQNEVKNEQVKQEQVKQEKAVDIATSVEQSGGDLDKLLAGKSEAEQIAILKGMVLGQKLNIGNNVCEPVRGEKSVKKNKIKSVRVEKQVKSVASVNKPKPVKKQVAKAESKQANTKVPYKVAGSTHGQIWFEKDNQTRVYANGDKMPNGQLIKRIDYDKKVIVTDRGKYYY